jgi:hypothetical protein
MVGLVKTETCFETTSMLIFNAGVGVREFGHQVARVCVNDPVKLFESLFIGYKGSAETT